MCTIGNNSQYSIKNKILQKVISMTAQETHQNNNNNNNGIELLTFINANYIHNSKLTDHLLKQNLLN